MENWIEHTSGSSNSSREAQTSEISVSLYATLSLIMPFCHFCYTLLLKVSDSPPSLDMLSLHDDLYQSLSLPSLMSSFTSFTLLDRALFLLTIHLSNEVTVCVEAQTQARFSHPHSTRSILEHKHAFLLIKSLWKWCQFISLNKLHISHPLQLLPPCLFSTCFLALPLSFLTNTLLSPPTASIHIVATKW